MRSSRTVKIYENYNKLTEIIPGRNKKDNWYENKFSHQGTLWIPTFERDCVIFHMLLYKLFIRASPVAHFGCSLSNPA